MADTLGQGLHTSQTEQTLVKDFFTYNITDDRLLISGVINYVYF